MRIALAALAALAALVPLSACTVAREAVHGPELSQVSYPAKLMPQNQEVLLSAREPMPQPASANSLWRTGARTFFNDQRAGRVGDILTVQIDIDDSAKTSNDTETERSNSATAGVPVFFGLETSIGRFMPSGFNPAKIVETSGKHTFEGSGSVDREEKINLTIAAIVTAVLPNGNMVIQGVQEVRTNAELRQLTVAGIVRPEDISSSNTIKHTQIAEARISYGGRGDISRVQKVPSGQSVVERFSPF
jgi:flagellar L-ring protein precursor FlgH